MESETHLKAISLRQNNFFLGNSNDKRFESYFRQSRSNMRLVANLLTGLYMLKEHLIQICDEQNKLLQHILQIYVALTHTRSKYLIENLSITGQRVVLAVLKFAFRSCRNVSLKPGLVHKCWECLREISLGLNGNTYMGSSISSFQGIIGHCTANEASRGRYKARNVRHVIGQLGKVFSNFFQRARGQDECFQSSLLKSCSHRSRF